MTPDNKTGTDATPTDTKVDPVVEKLKPLGVSGDVIGKIKSDLGVEKVEDLAELTEADLVSVGMAKIPARKVVAALKPAAAALSSTVSTVNFDDVLPIVPPTASWLLALKAGGISKVDQSTVIGAVRAALASRCGLYEVPDLLVTAMEKFTDETEEQLGSEFFKLRKQLTRRSYAEIFEAIDGLDGSFVTEARKKQLFARIDQSLWPAIINFYKQLRSWQEAWMQGAANPGLMMATLMSTFSGDRGVMPPGMMAPPDTGTLRDSADALADAINKVFRGTGVQIASALAYDANRIVETLANPQLPAMIGAVNRDQMLKKLGVAVPATYPRMEQNLTRFVLGILQVKDQPAGNEELRYFGALFMLGSQIPWDQLGVDSSGRLHGVGSGRRSSDPL